MSIAAQPFSLLTRNLSEWFVEEEFDCRPTSEHREL